MTKSDQESIDLADHGNEINAGKRFEFGRNWQRFLSVLNETRIENAINTLKDMLETDDLSNQQFLDVGSGSGLFSLAARRLGAMVRSFDYDPASVACTEELKRRYFPDDPAWVVEQGSVLDKNYILELGQFDVVYSWGVLHHTGAMWSALENVCAAVRNGGRLYIAIYNDQGYKSRRWAKIKKAYNKLPKGLRFLVLWPSFLRLWLPMMTYDFLKHGNPLRSWNSYNSTRGMSAWHDVVDWVGGHPFEVAKPEKIFDFYRKRGFVLERVFTCGGGHGCNEFVFRKI